MDEKNLVPEVNDVIEAEKKLVNEVDDVIEAERVSVEVVAEVSRNYQMGFITRIEMLNQIETHLRLHKEFRKAYPNIEGIETVILYLNSM